MRPTVPPMPRRSSAAPATSSARPMGRATPPRRSEATTTSSTPAGTPVRTATSTPRSARSAAVEETWRRTRCGPVPDLWPSPGPSAKTPRPLSRRARASPSTDPLPRQRGGQQPKPPAAPPPAPQPAADGPDQGAPGPANCPADGVRACCHILIKAPRALGTSVTPGGPTGPGPPGQGAAGAVGSAGSMPSARAGPALPRAATLIPAPNAIAATAAEVARHRTVIAPPLCSRALRAATPACAHPRSSHRPA